MSDCTCRWPAPTERGACGTCGGFACPYAQPGRSRCAAAICDCFVETYPDSPFALHPEAYAVRTEGGWFIPEPVEIDLLDPPDPDA